MKKIISALTILTLVFGAPVIPSAWAVDTTFNNGAGGNNWATVGNWTNGVPDTDDNAFITADVKSSSTGSPSVYSADFSNGAEWNSNWVWQFDLTVTTTATFHDTSGMNYGSIYGNAEFNDTSFSYAYSIGGDVRLNGASWADQNTIGGDLTAYGTAYCSRSYVYGNAVFYGTSYSGRNYILGDATFYTTWYNNGTAPSGGIFTIGTGKGWEEKVKGTVYGSDVVDGLPVAITSYVFNDNAYLSSYGKINGDATFNGTSYNGGIIDGDVTFNSASRNTGTINGDAKFDTNWYSTTTAPTGGELIIANGKYWGGKVTGAVTGNDDAVITSYVFNGNAYNSGTLNGDEVTFAGSGYNNGTINADVTFQSTSYNSGTITGDVTFESTSRNEGAINGDSKFDTNWYSTTTAPTGEELVIANGKYWKGTVNGTVKGSDDAAITSYVFNGNAYNSGTLNGDEVTFAGSGYNGGTINAGVTFNSTSRNTGTINGDAKFDTNWYSTTTAPAGGELIIANGKIWQGIVNGTVTGTDNAAITSYVFNGNAYNSGTLNGDEVTFAGSGYNNGTINAGVTFNSTSRNIGTINGDAKFDTNWYSTTTAPAGGELIIANGKIWQGSITGTVTGTDDVEITDYIFNGSAYMYGGVIDGNATFNGTSFISSGTISGNAIFHTTFYSGSSAPSGGVFTIAGGNSWEGTVAGTVYGTDLQPITSYVVNDNGFINGTVNGDVTLNTKAYSATVAPSGGVIKFFEGSWKGNVIGALYGSDAQPITDYIFYFSRYNSGTINGDVTFFDNSDNRGIINGNVVFDSTVAQRGTVNAGASGTVTGDFSTTLGITFQSGTVFSNISGAGGVTKSGAGTVALNGNNTYLGVTTITSGILSVSTINNGGTAGNLGAASSAAGNLVFNGGTLQYTGNTVGTDRNFTINAGKTATFDITANDLTLSGTSAATTGALTKTGNGTLILSGANLHTGMTTVSGGELDLDTTGADAIVGDLTVSGTGTLKLLQDDQISDTSRVTLTSGALDLNGMDETVTAFSNSGGVFMTGAGHLIGTGATVTWAGGTNTVNDGGTVEDAHIVITGGVNTVEGGVTGGVLQLNAAGTGLEMTGATLTLNSDDAVAGKLLLKGNVSTSASGTTSLIESGLALANIGTVDLDGGTRLFTVADGVAATDLEISAVITNGNLTKAGAGTLLLSGINTYTGTTTVNAGTLAYGANNTAGTVTLNGGTLDLGAYTVTLSGANAYTQAAGTTLALDILGASGFGKVVATGANATVDDGSTVSVRVGGEYIAGGTQFTIVDGAGGLLVEVPGTITSSSERVTFTGSVLNGDLILTANRTGSYDTAAGDGNGSAAGEALENAGANDPSGDMLTVLNTLDTLSNEQLSNALDSMTPDVSGGDIMGSQAMLGAFLSSVGNRLGFVRNGLAGGVATGDMFQGSGFWVQGLGSHAKQGERKGISGFQANTFGTAIGVDKIVAPHFRAGLAGGYSFADVNSKGAGSPSSDINSFQMTAYGSYDSTDLCKARSISKNGSHSREESYWWYGDGMLAFGANGYDSRRIIDLGTSRRVAKADHYGQQYGAKGELGFTLTNSRTKALEVTPFTSLDYSYLYMNDYKEKGAGALNLNVDGEGYHTLEQGLGMKFAYPVVSKKLGTFIPAVKAAWLYDYMADKFQSTSSFAGGGTSFASSGAEPAKNGMVLGGELTFLNKENMTLTGNYDLTLRDEYKNHTYYLTARFDF